MSSAFDRLKEEFLTESEETLAAFRADILLLGAETDARIAGTPAGAASSSGAIDRVFRTAHSLKGVLGMFGLDAMARVAHSLENVLEAMRSGQLEPDPAAIDDLLEASESLHELQGRARASESVDPASVDAVVARLDARHPEAAGLAPSPEDPIARAIAGLPEANVEPLRSAHARGDTVALVELSTPEDGAAARLADVVRAIRSWGVVHTIVEAPDPGATGDPAPQENAAPRKLRLVVSGAGSFFALAKGVGAYGAEVVTGDAGRALASPGAPDLAGTRAPISAGAADHRASSASSPATASTAGSEGSAALPPAAAPAQAAPSTEAAPTIRVRIDRVDGLLRAHAGILQAKCALDECAAGALERPHDRMRRTELLQSLRALDRKVRELQEEVLEVRLVSVGSLFPKLERAVWSAARDTGKRAALIASGGEVEVEKEIVDELWAPLLHLVRNAVDHGIEEAAVRRARGKHEAGTIRLAARSEGSAAVIEVADDGGGIDLPRVLDKGRARGFFGAQETPSPREIQDLLFHPGFSTRDDVSPLSGRGVGLDAVREAVARLGGGVEMDSGPEGTRFRIRVPTTRAILSGLLVRASGETFVLPLAPIARVVKVRPEEVEAGYGGEHVLLEDETIAVEDLGRLLGRRPVDRSKQYVTGVLLVGMGRRTLLLVDGVGARRDVVTQGLGAVRDRARGVVGSTELGDGRTLLLLDPSALLDSGAARRAPTEAGA